jgi:FMN-dependent dehydrogenase
MKVVLKGILTAEDAKLCVENGVDGIIVSNHGGRGEDSGGATIDALPEVVQAVGGRIPVLVDSGFRRAPTFSRRSRSAPTRFASGGRIYGGSVRSVRRVSSACSS